MLLYCIIMDIGKLHSTTVSSYLWPTTTSTTNIYDTKKKKMRYASTQKIDKERERERERGQYLCVAYRKVSCVWRLGHAQTSRSQRSWCPPRSDRKGWERARRDERGQGGVREDSEGWERARTVSSFHIITLPPLNLSHSYDLSSLFLLSPSVRWVGSLAWCLCG